MTPEQMLAAWIESGRPIAEFRSWHHDFASAIRNATLEEAAIVCEKISEDLWSLYKGRVPYTGQESGRADPYVEGESTGADKCSDAIRAMKTNEGE